MVDLELEDVARERRLRLRLGLGLLVLDLEEGYSLHSIDEGLGLKFVDFVLEVGKARREVYGRGELPIPGRCSEVGPLL